MIFSNQKKINEILLAKELLRIESKNKKVKPYAKYFLIVLATIGYIYALQIEQEKEILLIWIIIISIIYGVIIAGIIKLTLISKGRSLIMTENGIVINPVLAEFWEDLKGYGWETFDGFTKVSFSRQKSGVCLYLINRGASQRNIETWTGHTMLSHYGIFFTPEQMKQADEIFQKYGIEMTKILKGSRK